MKNKNIYCIAGVSGSGKTTLVEGLEKEYGLETVVSYTTRPKRSEDETGHIFITDEEFNQLENICAYTVFNGYQYGVTADFIDQCDTYVIDPAGIKFLRETYKGDKNIVGIALLCSPEEVARRMKKRGDSDEAIASRITHDKKAFEDLLDVCEYGIWVDTLSPEQVLTEVYNLIVSIEEGKYK